MDIMRVDLLHFTVHVIAYDRMVRALLSLNYQSIFTPTLTPNNTNMNTYQSIPINQPTLDVHADQR